MNLLCPNCQKMLSVPDQYAGQQMKCSMCGGHFTVPSLPAGPGPGDLAPPPPLSPAPLTSGSAPSPAAPPPVPDVYGMRRDLEPPPPSLGAPSSTATQPPPSLGSSPPVPPSFTQTPSTTPSTPSGPPVGYTHHADLYFSDKVLQWVPPVSVVLIVLFLQFFAWVGLYPGGVWKLSQSAWGVAFGSSTSDPDIGPVSEAKRLNPDPKSKAYDEAIKAAEEREYPGSSFIMILYVLFSWITLAVTLACFAYGFLAGKIQLPPQLQQLLPFRWGIVLALNVLVFLFLLLSVLFGFPLESKQKAYANAQANVSSAVGTGPTKEVAARNGQIVEEVKYTYALDLVVLLHILAILSAALVFWIQKRGPNHPLPKLELAW